MKIKSAGYLSDEILMEEIEAYRADCRKYGYRACLFDHINEPFEEMDLNCRVTHRTDISLQILNFLGRTGGEKKLKEVVSREDEPSLTQMVKEEMEKATGKRRKEVEKLRKCMNKEEEMSTYESNIWRMYNATRILVNYDKTMENESKWKPTDVSFKRLINSSDVQPLNARLPIFTSLVGISTIRSDRQPSNVDSSISPILSESFIASSEKQLANALNSTRIQLSGIVTSVRLKQ